ncbi:putative membrane domain protein [Mycobacterium kansasii]|uniref:Putative membrane domain protein n=1 Tax=Mycobacterium kansasii TaxID=1768 RepID=A0A1V3W9F4_MYCKA|nr:putative membrane domain protein [Mycobacterium kansasii]
MISKDRTVIMDSSSVGIPVDDPTVTGPGGLRRPDHQPRPLCAFGPVAIRSMGVENVSHGCISLSPRRRVVLNTVNVARDRHRPRGRMHIEGRGW